MITFAIMWLSSVLILDVFKTVMVLRKLCGIRKRILAIRSPAKRAELLDEWRDHAKEVYPDYLK